MALVATCRMASHRYTVFTWVSERKLYSYCLYSVIFSSLYDNSVFFSRVLSLRMLSIDLGNDDTLLRYANRIIMALLFDVKKIIHIPVNTLTAIST